MAERKVISKYYPPDFDASKLRPSCKPKTSATLPTIRIMSPFSMRCTSCSTYIYKGRKFNAKKEDTKETYLTISIYRFYIRCTACSSEICFKTDPKSTGFVCERGAVRNFEPWRVGERDEGQQSTDAMTVVEDKMVDAKTDMAVADALDEIRTRNARREIAANRLSSFSANYDVDGQVQNSVEDDQAASKAFDPSNERIRRLADEEPDANVCSDSAPTFRRSKRQKKNHSAVLGIKRK